MIFTIPNPILRITSGFIETLFMKDENEVFPGLLHH